MLRIGRARAFAIAIVIFSAGAAIGLLTRPSGVHLPPAVATAPVGPPSYAELRFMDETPPPPSSECASGSAETCYRLARHLHDDNDGHLFNKSVLDPNPPNVRWAVGNAIEACKRDHGKACSELADWMRFGGSRAPWVSDQEAVELDRRACALGALDGCIGLAFALRTGLGIERDAARASRYASDAQSLLKARCFTEDVAKTEAAACDSLLRAERLLAHNGNPGLPDATALAIAERGCRAGSEHDGCATLHLGIALTPKDPRHRILHKACALGNAFACAFHNPTAGCRLDPRACNFAAAALRSKKAAPAAIAEAAAQACNAGTLGACLSLAESYDKGEGVPIDHHRSQALLEEGCFAGDRLACSDASKRLSSLGKDEAVPATLRAAEINAYACVYAGSSEACVALASMSQQLVAQLRLDPALLDRVGHLELRQRMRACTLSLADYPLNLEMKHSCIDVGEIYRRGTLVRKDLERAEYWLQTACIQYWYIPDSCVPFLALLHERGDGKHSEAPDVKWTPLPRWDPLLGYTGRTIFKKAHLEKNGVERKSMCRVVASQPDPRLVYSLSERSLYRVRAQNGQGSAVAIEDNVLLTNCHVLEGQTSIRIDGSDYAGAAYPINEDPSSDRCVLIVPGSPLVPVCGVVPLREVSVGTRVYALGNPQDLHKNFTEGLISGADEIDGHIWLRTSASISFGSSGGALFDEKARLVGITTAIHQQDRAVGFAIPAEAFWQQ